VKSFGEWLMPSVLGTKIMAIGAILAICRESCPASLLKIHGGNAEGLRGLTDDGLQGGIRRSWFRIVY